MAIGYVAAATAGDQYFLQQFIRLFEYGNPGVWMKLGGVHGCEEAGGAATYHDYFKRRLQARQSYAFSSLQRGES